MPIASLWEKNEKKHRYVGKVGKKELVSSKLSFILRIVKGNEETHHK